MGWKDDCIKALDAERMFENSGHRTRFIELMECYSEYPFFSKGLCKCMYLSAWDEEHFAVMLETLTDMAIGREHDTEDMKIQGDMMADEHMDDHAYGEAFMFRLSGMFLENKEGKPEGEEKLSEGYRYLTGRALKAGEIVDKV